MCDKMGESYLQRKVLSRLRRTFQHHLRDETRSSNCFLASDMATTTKTMPQEPFIQTNSPLPSSTSAPLPLNIMIRQSSDSSSSSSKTDLNKGPNQAQNRILASRSQNQTANNNNTDTNTPFDVQMHSTNPKTLEPTCQQTRSKLKTATKAIFFFKRSKTSLSTRSARSSSTSNQSSGQQSRLNLNRQGTTDSSLSRIFSSASLAQHQQTSQLPLSASSDLPQFIVPKMNALRLPLVCLIKSLNGELMREVFVHRYELGEYLMESLKVSLGLTDCKYFGLKFAKSYEDQEDLRNNWLDLNESVCKQIKNNKSNIIQVNTSSSTTSSLTGSTTIRSIDFYLRVKFYPPNLTRVQDSFLRNYLWLQLRRDLRLGKLTSSMNNLTLLMACVLQYELGDYMNKHSKAPTLNLTSSESIEEEPNSSNQSGSQCQERVNSYSIDQRIADLNIMPNQDLIEEQAVELWRTRLTGMRQYQAQMQFLRAAVILETYGFDYYPVRDHQRQRAYLLGFNYAGVKTIRNGRIVHHFRWHNMSKISYERRMIIFHIYPNENSKRKQILGFKCLSNEDCQNLYMRLLEQKYFFTVDLAYFDKSVRKPSYLCDSQSDSLFDWNSLASPVNGSSPTPQQPTTQGSDHQAVESQHQLNQAEQSNENPESFIVDSSMVEHQSRATRGRFGTSNELNKQSSGASSSSTTFNLVSSTSTCQEERQQQQRQRSTTDAGSESSLSRCAESLCAECFPSLQLDSSMPAGCNSKGLETRRAPVSTSVRRAGFTSSRQLQRQQSCGCASLDPQEEPQAGAELSQPQSGRSAGWSLGGGWPKWGLASANSEPGRRSSARYVAQRVLEIAESVLVEPTRSSIVQSRPHSSSEISATNSSSRLLIPAIRLCLLILVMNLMLRISDSISSALIELLTFSSGHSSPPTLSTSQSDF